MNSDDASYLMGGRAQQILRLGNTVHRPCGAWTLQIHHLLHYLHQQGFCAVPKPLGFDEDGREIVSFIPGEVSNYPLSPTASSPNALKSAAGLLRRFHDASQGFLTYVISDPARWQLPPIDPQQVMCHGDYAPYNVVLEGETAVGIIDFDTCHPGPRIWDIAYALYRWAPLTHPDNPDGFGTLPEQLARARLFCDAYGLAQPLRPAIVQMMIKRLQALVDFMMTQAQAGNQTFEQCLQDGHHLLYLADIEYLRAHERTLKIELSMSS